MGASRKRRVQGALVGVAGLSLSLVLLGFILFATAATRDIPANPQNADGIVVLTGGAQRIEEAAGLLAGGRGKRLLISGVNRMLSHEDVHKLTGLPAKVFNCCVDIGYSALDTIGNAEEARDWSRRHGYKSLLVVTASYHMPRSLLELRRELPDVRLVPYPVLPKHWRDAPWYLDVPAFRVLASEYLKYVPAMVRAGFRKALAAA